VAARLSHIAFASFGQFATWVLCPPRIEEGPLLADFVVKVFWSCSAQARENTIPTVARLRIGFPAEGWRGTYLS